MLTLQSPGEPERAGEARRADSASYVDNVICTRPQSFSFFRRRRLGGSKDFEGGDYEMRLRIDEISRNDLDSPVVLVKEVRKKSGAGRSKSFTYQVQVSTHI